MKIAFIGDCVGKVHYNRYKAMSSRMNIQFDFFTIKTPNLSKKCFFYDAVYYASYTMYTRQAVKHPFLFGSATSWKCIFGKSHSKDMKLLSRFYKLSANNLSLANKLKQFREDIVYIPNGVDSAFFSPPPLSSSLNVPCITIGWVGNRDRAEKNYFLVKQLEEKKTNFKFKKIVTYKSTPPSKLRNKNEMRDFYRKLHWFLVTSSYEGTPNPALEASSCGVPLITTFVGNMPEIVVENVSGFFIKTNIKSILKCLNKLPSERSSQYKEMRQSIRNIIKDKWDWNIQCEKFGDFFKLDVGKN